MSLKHLNDNFYLEKDQRISLRDKIFREVISNLLIHREYTNAYPAKLIIDGKRVLAENSNRPHSHGIIDVRNFAPYPKNPTIAKFFREIGRADELGSGMRNIYKYNKLYSEAEPIFLEEDIFKTIIPLVQNVSEQATIQATMQADKLIDFCITPRTRNEMQDFMNLKNRDHFSNKILKPLVEKGLLLLMEPDKPTSPNQMYCSAKQK